MVLYPFDTIATRCKAYNNKFVSFSSEFKHIMRLDSLILLFKVSQKDIDSCIEE